MSQKWLKFLFSFIILILLQLDNTYSQSREFGEIRGFVYDNETGEPILFTNVYLEKTRYGASTNSDGFYHISRIPPGEYVLKCTYLGYDSISLTITIKAGDLQTHNLYIIPGAYELRGVEIIGERDEFKKDVKISTIKLTPAQIQRIPSVGGEPDLVQYLQVLPGVVFSGDQGGQIYIRGSSPVQSKVLMDGMTIYNPFHSIGLFSVFDVDAIRNVEVYTGGFNANYGGRTSSVMDISMREGNRRRHSGKISVNPFVSSLLLEGPLQKLDQDGNSISYIFSSRASYLEHTAPALYSYADTSRLPYNFLDFYAKTTVNAQGGSKMSLYGFKFSDRVNFENTTRYSWNAGGVGGEFLLLPSASATLIKGYFNYSNYFIEQHERDEHPRNSGISGFEGGMNFTYFPGEDHVKYGLDVSGYRTEFEFFNITNRRISQTKNTTEIGGYVVYKKILKKWIFEPGFRLHYYASHQEASPEPRLGIKYNAANWLRFKAATGLYSQNLISAHSDRDVVNLFYGFLSGPDNLPQSFDGKPVTSRLQKASHLIAGVEMDISTHSSVNIETYYMSFSQLTNINRNKVFDNSPSFWHHPEKLRLDYIVEKGRSYGMDFLLHFEQNPYYLWVAYSLGFVDRYDGEQTYNPHWDRRHNLNIVGAYQFGNNNSWEFSARWNFGSGFPFTQTKGFYELLDFQKGLNTDYTTENGNLGILYADINQGRLSYYHRLDLSLKKTIIFNRNSRLIATASVINVYNRSNVFYFDRVNHQRVDQLPILPSLGLSYTF